MDKELKKIIGYEFKQLTSCAFALNLVFIFVLLQSATAQTDDVLPINFAAGETSAVVRAEMKRKDGIRDYKVYACSGQVMSVSLISKDRKAYFSIICPGCLQVGDTPFGMKDAYKIRRWTSKIPDTGDYVIRVGSSKLAAFAYAIEVSVRDQNLSLEDPELIKQITGRYVSKNNSLDAQLLPNGNLKFHLIALWKSPTNREVINTGEISGVLPMKNNFATYEKGICKITLKFSQGRSEILQLGSESACDFGMNVTVDGTYWKRNSRIPKFDF